MQSTDPPPITFSPFDLRAALVFHRVYHASRGIQVNHWVFLPCYLLGVFLALTNFWAQMAAYVLLSVYALGLTGRVVGGSYVVFLLSPLLFLAWVLTENLANQPAWVPAATGGGIALASLLLQLVGHAKFEKLKPPPTLMHGLVAAPMLEWMMVGMECYLATNPRKPTPTWLFNGIEDVDAEIFDEAERLSKEYEAKFDALVI